MQKEPTRPALWILDRKKQLPDFFNRTVISPLHYGETIELCFVRGIGGETVINGKALPFREKNVFFIPPKHLHTSFYRTGGKKEGDMVCAFHINVEGLLPYVDIKRILFQENPTLFDSAMRCDDFDTLWNLVQRILDESRPFTSAVIDLLCLLERISMQQNLGDHVAKRQKTTSELIDYVEENYKNKLSVQTAASHFGYSVQYFCKWFKMGTGITFNTFLNSVRIHHARAFLSQGSSVEETAERCGFSDPSYFAKVFKHLVGIPPKTYAAEASRR